MTEAASAASVPASASARPAFGIGPDGTYTTFGQVAAFVLGLLTTFVFVPLVVVAAKLYLRAETVFAEDPARARKLVTWSWISIAVPSAIGVVLVAVAVALSAG
jgi:hypothetical protein